jgi:hypothetical protein
MEGDEALRHPFLNNHNKKPDMDYELYEDAKNMLNYCW